MYCSNAAQARILGLLPQTGEAMIYVDVFKKLAYFFMFNLTNIFV